MEFINFPDIQFEYKDSDNVKRYSFKDDLQFKVKSNYIVVVPADIFLFTLNSIPKPLEGFLKPTNKYIYSKVLQDFLYAQRNFKRSVADTIYRSALKSQKVNFFTRWFFYFIVRLFGWKYKS